MTFRPTTGWQNNTMQLLSLSRAKQILSLAQRLSNVGLVIDRANQSDLKSVFAAAIEASRRAHGLVHYPVQVLAGLRLCNNQVVEMQTGEGKTLTAIGQLLKKRQNRIVGRFRFQ